MYSHNICSFGLFFLLICVVILNILASKDNSEFHLMPCFGIKSHPSLGYFRDTPNSTLLNIEEMRTI